MGSQSITMPPFGDIVNAAIQVVKTYSNTKNGISVKNFHKDMAARLQLTEQQLSITVLNPEADDAVYSKGFIDEYFLDNAFDEILQLVVEILAAIGLITIEAYPLYVNTTHENFIEFVAFDAPVTADNIIKIDPFGKIYFWLACHNFHLIDNATDFEKDYLSNLATFEARSFHDLKGLNYACYGDDGDELINHLMTETLRRCSVFMNNYNDVDTSGDYTKATPEKILKRIFSLSPLRFELLCLKVVEASLKSESPEATYECDHVGKTNDGGLDGIIKQTFPTGEQHTYYIQAKLYQSDNKISNHHLRNFVGAYPPDAEHHHGIFITTSDFTAPAVQYANSLTSHNLILINQIELLDQMQAHEVGLERVQIETLVMNNDFFRQLKK